jgi:hypothetical protein
MSPIKRIYSNLKDAFGYFGLKALWQRKSQHSAISHQRSA